VPTWPEENTTLAIVVTWLPFRKAMSNKKHNLLCHTSALCLLISKAQSLHQNVKAAADKHTPNNFNSKANLRLTRRMKNYKIAAKLRQNCLQIKTFFDQTGHELCSLISLLLGS